MQQSLSDIPKDDFERVCCLLLEKAAKRGEQCYDTVEAVVDDAAVELTMPALAEKKQMLREKVKKDKKAMLKKILNYVKTQFFGSNINTVNLGTGYGTFA